MNTVAIRKTFTFKNLSFLEFFFPCLGLILLSLITFGLAFPYFYFWTVRYFYSKMELGDKPVTFTGKLSEFYFPCLGLFILYLAAYCFFSLLYNYGELSFFMLGVFLLSATVLELAWLCLTYWLYKYFFENLEVEENRIQFNKKLGLFFLAYLGFFVLSIALSIALWISSNVFSEELSIIAIVVSISTLVVLIITFWVARYFHTGLGWKEYKSVFNANFIDFFLPSIGIIFISIITLGLGLIYAIYWMMIFFYTNTEFVEEPAGVSTSD